MILCLQTQHSYLLAIFTTNILRPCPTLPKLLFVLLNKLNISNPAGRCDATDALKLHSKSFAENLSEEITLFLANKPL